MKKRLILTEKNIPRFLKSAARNFPFELKKVTSVKEVTKYSNASFVYKANCFTSEGRQVLYLKQSDEFAKRNREIRVEPERVVIENEKIKLLEVLLGKGKVPHVLYVDYQNYVLVMQDIQGKKKMLIEEFANNKVYSQLAEKFGIFFGTLHGKTYNTPPVFNDTAWQRRIYNVWRDWLMFGARKHIAKNIIDKFINQSEKSTKVLVWGDPVHRNIFVGRNDFSVLDFDFTMHYDPALDSGMFLAHWVIKMLEGNSKVAKDCRFFIRDFIKAYVKTVKSLDVSEQEARKIMKRAVVWTGVYMVSRTDGKSGSYYKKWPKWENKIREAGIALVTAKRNKTSDWYKGILTK